MIRLGGQRPWRGCRLSLLATSGQVLNERRELCCVYVNDLRRVCVDDHRRPILPDLLRLDHLERCRPLALSAAPLACTSIAAIAHAAHLYLRLSGRLISSSINLPSCFKFSKLKLQNRVGIFFASYTSTMTNLSGTNLSKSTRA
jgi:hypothetical protein